jgi:hypothetical protein
MSQGVAWDKEKVIELLEPLLRLDYSVTKACKIIGIAQSTVQTWIDEDEELRLKVQSWRAEPSVKARKNWIEAIENGVPTKNGMDKYTPAKEWLERREKDAFSTKQKQDNNLNVNVNPTPILESLNKSEE